MISLKQRVADAFGQVDLSQGIRHALWHEYYDDFPDNFPCKSPDGKQSLAMVLESWQWPDSSDFIELTDFPDHAATPYSEDIQGVTHLDDQWILIPKAREVFVWPKNVDLGDDTGYVSVSITNEQLDEAYDHFGDCGAQNVDVNTWRVFSAIEGKQPNVIGVFEVSLSPSLTITYEHSVVYPERQGLGGNSAPWCTYDAYNNRIYSSLFDPDNGVLDVFFYEYDHTIPSLSGKPDGMSLRQNDGQNITAIQDGFKRIQGGTTAARGHLYLTCDNRDGPASRGIHGFDLVSGRRMVHILLPEGSPTNYDYEIEGLTAWDVTQMNIPYVSGVLHVTILDNDFAPGDLDEMTFKHFDLPPNKRHLL